MGLIGALIGGFTNHIAIKMLFRPYEAKYIGGRRLPFTPGLIPKRRDELARQLGKTVVEHLLTPETFKKRFFNDAMRERLAGWAERQLAAHVFKSPRTFREWFQLAGQTEVDTKAEQRIDSFINQQFLQLAAFIEGKTVRELMPDLLKAEVEQRVDDAAPYVIDRGIEFFASADGRAAIRSLIDEFLATRGRFGLMLQSLFGESESLVDRVQQEMIKFLTAPNTEVILGALIRKEWEKFLDKRADALFGQADLMPAVDSVKTLVKKKAAISARLDLTVAQAWPKGLEWTMHNLIPTALDSLFVQGEAKLEEMIQKINMEEMVREQVDSFPLNRIEDLVLGISRREFKMITVLGAVLGGVIGLVQGLLVQLMNMI
ncbi:hypothetical protein B0X71_05145 [Planococcus lenghuensis]|uniref:DUF445 domain-containing protein n=2 Tax=Planococcus lenghuensis TaxID=2213202 RepID=A0A1Q2L4K3_9BACL|nr:hypothetical protein B0X71_05145 [Planococcus lenghuensis]